MDKKKLANNKEDALEQPLVSIIVITYNSSKYVLETLESAKAQTYQNIELIVSDDCSTDNTVEICREWIEKNKKRFLRTELITSEKNTGIPANCNRGVKAAQGEWVKLIAGDDILCNNCIEANIEYAKKNSSSKLILSKMKLFDDNIKKNIGESSLKDHILFKHPINPSLQRQWLLNDYFGNTPTLFIKRDIFDFVQFDETIFYMEDYPFALNVTKKGFYFEYFDKTTVKYRIHDNSICMSHSQKKLFNDFYVKKRIFYTKYIYPEISIIGRIFMSIEYYRKKIIDKLGLNKNNLVCKLISAGTYRISPYFLYNKLKIHESEKQIRTTLKK